MREDRSRRRVLPCEGMSSPKCPVCAARAARRDKNPAFPFCSERCRLVDLGKWLDGGYRVPATESTPSVQDLEGNEP